MPLVDLDDPEELRARWSALAAVAHATGFDRRWYADENGWYHQDETGSDLRMVRLEGGRAVLFGFHTQHSRTAEADLLAGAPDWIGQPEVKRRIAAGQLGFVYGSFNGTWARASYPGDPWQPLDDGFLPIGEWLTSDEEAAREMIEWAAEWADYLGGLDELLPVGVGLIRTAATTGITPGVLAELFQRLEIGSHSPQQPDIRAALVAVEAFNAVSAPAPVVDSPPAEPDPDPDLVIGAEAPVVEAASAAEYSGGGYAADEFDDFDDEEEESVVVAPGISPFTGMPIGDDANLVIGGGSEPFASEPPFTPEPPFNPEPPFTPEPPFRPDSPFAPDPPPYAPEPTDEPPEETPPPPPPAEAEYGVTAKKRRFGRKRKQDDGEGLVRLGLVGPDPEPAEPPQPSPPAENYGQPSRPDYGQPTPPAGNYGQPLPPVANYERPEYGEDGPAGFAAGDYGPLPSAEPPRVGAPVDDGEDYYASLFADAPAAATYRPDVVRPPEAERLPWSAEEATSEFVPFTDDTAPVEAVSPSDDTGVIPPVPDTNPFATQPEAPSESEARQAEIHEADFRDAEAREAEARAADNREVQARDAQARDAEIREADFREAQARDAQAREANFREAQDREAQAREADFREVQAREAEAREAQAREAEVRAAEVREQAARAAEAEGRAAAEREAEAAALEAERWQAEARDAEAREADFREAQAREAQAREMRAREAEVREQAAREAEAQAVAEAEAEAAALEAEAQQAREADARETQAREVQAREAEQAEAQAREVQAREGEARQAEAQAREVEARDAEVRQAREADARETQAREAEAREAEARETQAREVEAREAEDRTREAEEQQAQVREVEAREAEGLEVEGRAASGSEVVGRRRRGGASVERELVGGAWIDGEWVEDAAAYLAAQETAREAQEPTQGGGEGVPVSSVGVEEPPTEERVFDLGAEPPTEERVFDLGAEPPAEERVFDLGAEPPTEERVFDLGAPPKGEPVFRLGAPPTGGRVFDLGVPPAGERVFGLGGAADEEPATEERVLDVAAVEEQAVEPVRAEYVDDLSEGPQGDEFEASRGERSNGQQQVGLEDEAPTAEIAAVADVGPAEHEDEYYASSESPFAVRELPANGFSSLEPEEFEYGPLEPFRDEILGGADWTADQLGETAWVPAEQPNAEAEQSSAEPEQHEPEVPAARDDEALEAVEPIIAAAAEGNPAAGLSPLVEADWGDPSAAEVTAQFEAVQAEPEPEPEQEQEAEAPADVEGASDAEATAQFEAVRVQAAAEQEPEAEPADVERPHEDEAEAHEPELVAPPPSTPVAIPGIGVVGGDGPLVEAEAGSIEEAMRAERERPRPRPKKSAAFAALHEWCRARTRIVPSGFTIQVQVLDPAAPSYRFDLEPPEVDDPQYGAERLSELLGDLWEAESQGEQGGWLFARIDAAGRTMRVDRWYDQVPDWWDNPVEPRLDVQGLVRRLNGRGPDWQPSYLEKLYTTAR